MLKGQGDRYSVPLWRRVKHEDRPFVGNYYNTAAVQ